MPSQALLSIYTFLCYTYPPPLQAGATPPRGRTYSGHHWTVIRSRGYILRSSVPLLCILTPCSPLPNVNTMTDISIQNKLLKDQRRHDRASAQLHDELRQAQHDITLIITQLHQECRFHDEARAEFELERSRFLQHHEQLQRTIDATLHRQENLEEALDSLQENQLESSLSAPSITSPMKKLLETYHELDEDSKKALLTSAITSNNTDLQWAILQLRDSKKNNNNSSAQA
jgi:hypothetical protein